MYSRYPTRSVGYPPEGSGDPQASKVIGVSPGPASRGSRRGVCVSSRLLIADDNATVRRLLRVLLETHDGWEVCGEAENGLEAVAKAKELKPDAVILDLAMPVMDGLRATREISEALPGTPVLIHTLHNAPGMELEVKKAGAREIINKTDSADKLVKAIEEGLAARRELTTPLSAEPSPQAAAASNSAGNGSSETPSASDDPSGGAKPN